MGNFPKYTKRDEKLYTTFEEIAEMFEKCNIQNLYLMHSQSAVKTLTLLQDRSLADFATGVGRQVDDQ